MLFAGNGFALELTTRQQRHSNVTDTPANTFEAPTHDCTTNGRMPMKR